MYPLMELNRNNDHCPLMKLNRNQSNDQELETQFKISTTYYIEKSYLD